MSGKTMLENKRVLIDDREYRLTIKKEIRYAYGTRNVYVCYLSDVDSQFSISRVFGNLKQLERGLELWIVEADIFNDPESRVFKKIEQWDGVIK